VVGLRLRLRLRLRKTAMTDSNKTKQHYTAGDLVGRGDLTRALIELLQVPKPKRDDDWHKTEHLVRATLNDIVTPIPEDLTIPIYPTHKQDKA
jgi:hypothetical protein